MIGGGGGGRSSLLYNEQGMDAKGFLQGRIEGWIGRPEEEGWTDHSLEGVCTVGRIRCKKGLRNLKTFWSNILQRGRV